MFSNFQRFIPQSLVLIIGLGLSLVFFNVVQKHNQSEEEKDFQQAALERIAVVNKRISSELTVLRSIVGFYQGSDNVEESEFHTFVNTVLLDKESFQALEWIPRIPHAQRDDYVQQARNNGYGNFMIKEKSPEGKIIKAGQRAEYFPVYFIEPFQGNDGAHGFDLASNPVRLAALRQARDSATMVASSQIKLVQLKEDNVGVLLFAPVYAKGQPNDTLAQRRQNLSGFALGIIRVSSLISGLHKKETGKITLRPAEIDLYFFEEGAANKQVPLYVHSSRLRTSKAPDLSFNEARAGLVAEHTFKVGGRTWTIIAKPIVPNHSEKIALESWIVLIASLLITGTLCVYVGSLSRRANVINALVHQRTEELNLATQVAQDRETRISAVLETIVDGIITIDQYAKIKSSNLAAEKIFGYTSDEMIDQNIGFLMADPYRTNHLSYLKENPDTEITRVMGKTQEIMGVRKNGDQFPMELTVGEMKIGGKKMYTTSVRDITDRKQAEKMKADFVSTVSHELRTPLTSIKGALGLIKSNAAGDLPDKLKSMFDIAYSNSDRLVRLINDILDVEKISAGQMECQMETIDLTALLEQALEANEGYGNENDVTFTLKLSGGDSKVRGDSGRLMQVMANLLSNAAKFSPRGDCVEISLTSSDQWLRVSVSDNGPGIPEEFHEKIFERFSQADSSDTRQKGGTGLGLNITKSIVEIHGGTIDFETEPGKGTTFFFNLPTLSDGHDKLPVHSNNSSQPHILICEDDPDIALLLEKILKQEGYTTDTARNASQASAMANANNYDAMTLDIGLPDRDGISLIREFRQNSKTENLPIIVVSAMADESKKNLNGDAIGILDWLEKPIDEESLAKQLRQVIANSSNEKTNILHIEDDPDIIKVVSELISDFATIVPAHTLVEAKQLLERQSYDLVILDLMLPDGSGDELLPLLNELTPTPPPVIIFSAKELSKQGADKVMAALVKSQTTNENLLNTIRSAMESGHQMPEQV